MKSLPSLLACLIPIVVGCTHAQAPATPQNREAELPSQTDHHAFFPPFRVVGNLYHVGQTDFASYLITSPEGHILINPNFEDSVPGIRKNVESLGFRFSDIKILLGSHAHSDHMEGMAAAFEATGAKVFVMAGDDDVIRNGKPGDPEKKRKAWRPAKIDRVLQDQDTVEFGGNTLVAHLTPGHTRGNTTWTMKIREGDKSYDVVIIGSLFVNEGMRLVDSTEYPGRDADYARSFAVSKSLPCDVFLGAHGSWFDMVKKYKLNLAHPDQNAFIDPAGYQRRVDLCEKAFLDEREKQQADPQRRAPNPNNQLGPPNRLD